MKLNFAYQKCQKPPSKYEMNPFSLFTGVRHRGSLSELTEEIMVSKAGVKLIELE